jgi:hypothetical protein
MTDAPADFLTQWQVAYDEVPDGTALFLREA